MRSYPVKEITACKLNVGRIHIETPNTVRHINSRSRASLNKSSGLNDELLYVIGRFPGFSHANFHCNRYVMYKGSMYISN